MKTQNFAGILLKWFEQNRRNYAWRKETSPYEILIAEIMLQRTKADQVERVYLEFMERYPDVGKLSHATEEELEKYFRRLGLVWRAALIRQLASELNRRFCGKVPDVRESLLSLPLVGEYNADAILSFAYNKDVAVVDTNVCRILSRVFGIKAKGEARRNKTFRQLIQQILPQGRSKEFNWAMIDFGSLICTPRNPKCEGCVMSSLCLSSQSN